MHPINALPVDPARGVLTPLPLENLTLDPSGFWGRRVAVNADATFEHTLHWLERAGWLANFDLAVRGGLAEGRRGREFSDSEVYKTLEGLCWHTAGREDEATEATIRALTARIVAAQEPDGYLGTRFGREGQAPRYSDLEWGHELYNAGHFLQAAVARLRTHGEDELTTAARRLADHICAEFGPDGRDAICGHPEIEVGLTEFARATGESRYADQARLFVDRRGRGLLEDIEWGRAYFQDDLPVREAGVLRGHAVRALYLTSAVVDLAVDSGDDELLAIVERQWENTVARRTYITGGMGSHHQDEAFGADFELPNDRAYCETCAGVGSVMLSWRLLLATGEPRYADLIERTLHNIIATAVSEDGRSFFYANTLHRREPGVASSPDEQSKRADSSQRAAWFDVACCPNNLARTFASLAGYLATTDGSGVQVHQYASGTFTAALTQGDVEIGVRSDLPATGAVSVHILSSPATAWTLTLRIPTWAEGARAVLVDADGTRSEISGGALRGSLRIERVFHAGDRVELDLPLTPVLIFPDDRIDAARGTVAVQRGPEIWCLESADLPEGVHVDDVSVSVAAGVAETNGRVVLQGGVSRPVDSPWPFSTGPRPSDRTASELTLSPYRAWGSRGPVSMRIWLPIAAD
ncbi:glycoside hydrolase family 127 protein [Rathayibacter sp. Leaf248]|uniref:glycoside hydrolase family 127 protein n=1 Tax=Rathayibacter sp. Leaf248 TaxID=2876555 RepID=UPI001E2CA454|nr:beta-L-arabinofuranosidase domain-containing protein [Rathayibacter sp. Leaf248]